MRRKDREITDVQLLDAILSAGQICSLALHDQPHPYVLPMNYGYRRENGRLSLYLHCAPEGKKMVLMQQNPQVAFTIVGRHWLYGRDSACSYSMAYESVIGYGVLHVLHGEEKKEGLRVLMQHVAPDAPFDVTQQALAAVSVLRLAVEQMTGKGNRVNDHE